MDYTRYLYRVIAKDFGELFSVKNILFCNFLTYCTVTYWLFADFIWAFQEAITYASPFGLILTGIFLEASLPQTVVFQYLFNLITVITFVSLVRKIFQCRHGWLIPVMVVAWRGSRQLVKAQTFERRVLFSTVNQAFAARMIWNARGEVPAGLI